MRRCLALLLAFGTSACARHVYSAPVPATVPAVTSSRSVPVARNAVSTGEAVDYLLARSLAIPVAGITTDELHDSFDEGRDGSRMHRALDIMAVRGTPVLSADSGRILRMSANTLGGNIIYASDPLGRIVYYYAHLDAYQPGLENGMPIARGDTLGFVGTTGNAPKDTPHLHFQVMRMPPDGKYWDGDPINPYPLLLLMHFARR